MSHQISKFGAFSFCANFELVVIMNDSKHLNTPKLSKVHFDKNFLGQVVCELRFPTVFELDAARPPLTFAKTLKKDFPIYEARKSVNVSNGLMAESYSHIFKEKKSRYAVTLRTSSIALEAFKYNSFDEFRKNLEFVLNASKNIIDTDFFTRVGLRYINFIDFADGDAKGWINPALNAALCSDVFGSDIQEFTGRISGSIDNGVYLLSHGLGGHPEDGRRGYVIDTDFSSEDILAEDVLNVITQLHDEAYSLFRWTLGEKANQYLKLPATEGDV